MAKQALQQLSFESISEVDNGAVALAVDQALRQVFFDLRDRPHVGGVFCGSPRCKAQPFAVPRGGGRTA